MNPERLLVMALRSGIDLTVIASHQPPTDRMRPQINAVIRQRQLRAISALPKQHLPKGLPRELTITAKGKQGPLTKPPTWTPDDFAAACQSMSRLPWALLCFTVMPNDDDRITVKSALLSRLSKVAVRESWPKKIRRANCHRCGRSSRQFYLEDLCTLAMREWTDPDAYRTQEQLALWFGISREEWSRAVSRRYQHARDLLERWYGTAMGHLWRSLTQGEEQACAESMT